MTNPLSDAGARTPARRPRTSPVLAVMAVAAGLSVAGNYFAQPLLGLLRTELGMTTTAAGLTVAAAQIGYAIGLGLLVPLGDRYPRRGLAATLLAATGLLLAAAGTAPTGWLLLAATGLAAVTSVGAQVLVPFAAELAPPQRRARDIGIVMAGVLAGGLLGRAASGVVAELAGWRTVYWATAVLLLVTAVIVLRVLPGGGGDRSEATRPLRLWRSTAALLAELPGLRRPIAIAALTMASFTVHLTVVTLLLVDHPYRWSPATIGLVGLIGVIGPLAMPLAGRLVDRGYPRAVLVTGLLSAAAGWAVMLPAQGGGVGWLLVGLVLLNVGQTAVLNASQTTAYELRPRARSRINAVFMTLFFAGGSVGGALAPVVWVNAHWTGACLLGIGLVGTALLVAAVPRRRA
ncbi:MFS transporter [Nocardiopsis sp. N85]|uniref:MFS transporter n=1 Tax=Nocardiopsis sp. N85 TaxID=3029400 RepID=UPI00237F37F8|nr:MFS transporter [Nocardiopsis sp. N85]MDE3725040.1 MFS transporter [Nocardiopsis sp. N85]